MTQNLRILIVEDSESWQRRLVRHFKRIGRTLAVEFKTPDVAKNLAEAEQLLASHRYDLATVDINLEANNPENRDGLAVLEQLRALGVQAIVVRASGEDNPEASRAAIEASYAPAAYLLKDQFSYDLLEQAVEQALAPSG